MWQKIHGVTLTQKDRDVILDREWLNDIINGAQLLMKHDQDLLPVASLQNPLLGQTLAFDVISDEIVQILHSGGNHWITISTVGTKHPTVKIFDSLYTMSCHGKQKSRLPLYRLRRVQSLWSLQMFR